MQTRLAIASTVLSLGLCASPAAASAPQAGNTSPRAAAGHVSYDATPVVTTTLESNPVLYIGEYREFQVTVTDPEGSKVSLRLLNPQPELILPDLVDAPSPATVSGRWLAKRASGGRQQLVFEARDDTGSGRVTRHVVEVDLLGTGGSSMRTGDVTGDGILDLVVTAKEADVGTAVDAGAVYVWAGGSNPSGAPTATLTLPTPAAGDFFSRPGGGNQGLHLVDVSGDGLLDIVVGTFAVDAGGVADSGAIAVFVGGAGLVGAQAPDALLSAPGATAGDGMCSTNGGQSILFHDVTGDAVADVICASYLTDLPGAINAGAVYVFAGGPGLKGDVAPHARLVVASPGNADQLCGGFSEQELVVVDLTADGVMDIIAVGGLVGADDKGTLCMWEGGAGLSGVSTPTALFSVPAAEDNDFLGWLDGECVLTGDVTGDGTLDLISGTRTADLAGMFDVGALYVWAGAAGLTGTSAPIATLTIPGASNFDYLGDTDASTSVELVDLTGDGVLDIVTGSAVANVNGVIDAGALYVFEGGGALSGGVTPRARLLLPSPGQGDKLGAGLLPWCQFSDLDGDGVLDLIVGSETADHAGVTDAGLVLAWRGGATLSGDASPWSTLAIPAANSGDRLSSSASQSIQCVDVNGDGIRDLVVGAPFADAGGSSDVGAIFVWSGAALAGAPAPAATLTLAGAKPGEAFSSFQVVDLTGDGQLDVICRASLADTGGVVDAGALHVWVGGAGLVGSVPSSAVLSNPAATADDRLGDSPGTSYQFADLTDDGICDVLVATQNADVGGVSGTGHLLVFAGSSSLSGSVAPVASLSVPGASPFDFLGTATSQGTWLCDVTGDGILDAVAQAYLADVAGVVNAGALYVWNGGTTLTGALAPSTSMAVPNASESDLLGS